MAVATNVVSLQQSIGRVLESEMQRLMLARGNEEFSFRIIDPAKPPKLPSEPKRAQIILVASPDYLKRRGNPVTPQDLAGHDCLRQTQRGMRPRTMHLVNAEHRDQQLDQEVNTALWANHIDTLLRAASDGMGITSTSVDLVANQLATGELVQVVRPWIVGEITLFAALPSRKFLPRRTQVFLDYLTEQSRLQVSTALTMCSDC